MLAGSTWKRETVDLKPGDYLFAYTDGITEALNEKGELFGEERLMRVLLDSGELSPRNLVKSIVRSVDDFIGTVPHSDDITLYVLRAG